MDTRLLPLLSLVLAQLLACGDETSGTGGSGAGGGGTSSGGGSGVTHPPTGTGIEVVDRLGAAAAACGSQSVSTIPGGWESVAVGDLGCMVWVPGNWIVQGAGSPIVTMFADQSGLEGALGVAGGTEDLPACTPIAARDALLSGFSDGGFAAPTIAWHQEAVMPFGGTDWATAQAVFQTSRAGTPLVGYLWVLTTQTVLTCDVVCLGFWEPEANIEADTCTVLQILNSVTCPSGGECDDVECDLYCKDKGFSGGSCGFGCTCH
jgi:hypothetical protein